MTDVPPHIFLHYGTEQWKNMIRDALASNAPTDFSRLQKPKYLWTNFKKGLSDLPQHLMLRREKFGKNTFKDIADLENFIFYQVVRYGKVIVLTSPEILPGDLVLLSKSPFIVTFDCAVVQDFDLVTSFEGNNKQMILNGTYVHSGYALAVVLAIGRHCEETSSLIQRSEGRNLKKYKFCLEMEKYGILFARMQKLQSLKMSGIEKSCTIVVDMLNLLKDVKLKFLWNRDKMDCEKDFILEQWNEILSVLSLSTLGTFVTKNGIVGNFLVSEIFRFVNKIKKFDANLYRSDTILDLKSIKEENEVTKIVYGDSMYCFGYYQELIDICDDIQTKDGVLSVGQGIRSKLESLEQKGYFCYILAKGTIQGKKSKIKVENMTILTVFVFSGQIEENLITEIQNSTSQHVNTIIMSPFSSILTEKVLKGDLELVDGKTSNFGPLGTRIVYKSNQVYLNDMDLYRGMHEEDVFVTFGVSMTSNLIFDYGNSIYLAGKGSPDFVLLNRGYIQCLNVIHRIKRWIKSEKCHLQ